MTKEEFYIRSAINDFQLRISRKERIAINKTFRTKFKSNRKALIFLEKKIMEIDPWTGRIDRFKEFGTIVKKEMSDRRLT